MLSTWNGFSVFDRLFDDVMTGAGGTASNARTFAPAIDVRANETEIVFTADVPGLKDKDLEITLHDGVLSIKGERKYEGNDKDKVLLGRAYGSFVKSYTLPDTVDPEKLSASLEDGVLTVRVAQQPKREPKKILINPTAK